MMTKIVKLFSNTKIDTLEERKCLQILAAFYYLCFSYVHIDVENKEQNAKDILNTFYELFAVHYPSFENADIVQDWYKDAFSTSMEFRKSLELYLHTKDMIFYYEAINQMDKYCERNVSCYEEWKVELTKYKEGERKALIAALWLAFWIGIEIFSSFQYKNNAQENQKYIEKTEDISSEMDVSPNLSRKL